MNTVFNVRRIFALMRVEFLRLRYDRISMGIIFLVPAIQVLLFGGAIHFQAQHTAIALGGSPAPQTLMSVLHNNKNFTIVAENLPVGEAEQFVRSGKADLALEFAPPADFDHPDAETTSNKIILDAARPQNPAVQLNGIVQNLLNVPSRGKAPHFDTTYLFNPDQKASWVIMPALSGIIVMISMLLMGALTLVREREQGRWESLLASPATSIDIVCGKLAPYVVIGIFQAGLVLFIAAVFFHVPMLGSVMGLMLAVVPFALAHLLLGFAISAAAETQIQAIQTTTFFYLPSIILSGFVFPFDSMPPWAQWVGHVLPTTYFVEAARAMALKGAGVSSILITTAPIWIFVAVMALLAVSACRRRLD